MQDRHMQRRERTRQLIELGGLVVKAGLVDLTDDDRVTIYGALLNVAEILRGEDREQRLVLWRRKGKRGFEDADKGTRLVRPENVVSGGHVCVGDKTDVNGGPNGWLYAE